MIAARDGVALALSGEGASTARETSAILSDVSTGNDELVRSSFDAFLRGDWDALARVMEPEVQWLWYASGDRDCHDRQKVLATLFERQREGVVTGLKAASPSTNVHGRHRR